MNTNRENRRESHATEERRKNLFVPFFFYLSELFHSNVTLLQFSLIMSSNKMESGEKKRERMDLNDQTADDTPKAVQD